MASDEPNLDNEDPNMAADFVVIERLEGLLARQRALSTSVRQLTETVEDLEKRTRAGVYAARLQEETWRVTGAFMCVCVPILVAYVFEYKTRDVWNTDIMAMRELYSGFMMSLSVFAALPFFICVVFEFMEFKCRLDQEFYPEQTAETFMTELGKSSGDEGCECGEESGAAKDQADDDDVIKCEDNDVTESEASAPSEDPNENENQPLPDDGDAPPTAPSDPEDEQ